MDERARLVEREAARDGGASARVQLAHVHRRAGRWADVLVATEGLSEPDALAVRAEALLRADQPDLAADAAASARALGGGLGPDLAREVACALFARVPPGDRVARLHALGRVAALCATPPPELEAAVRDPDPFARAQAARAAALAPDLRDDAVALVRFVARRVAAGQPEAALRAAATRTPDEPPRTRLFSAHGPDYEFDLFVALDASGEARFAFLDLELLRLLDQLLGGAPRQLGFSREGYGLAVAGRTEVGELEQRVAAIDRAAVLPFPVRVVGLQPYDPLGALADEKTDDALCDGYVRDLRWHPVRHFGAKPDAPTYARVAAGLREGHTPAPGELAALVARAREEYTPLGLRALERFVKLEGPGGRRPRATSAEKAARERDDERS